MKKLIITLFLSFVLGIVPLGLPGLVEAWNWTDTYQSTIDSICHTNGSVCNPDARGFYQRQCTSYVSWKVYESGITNFLNWMTGPNGNGSIYSLFGNAGNWDDHANDVGFLVDNTPTVGSVAVWNPNALGGMPVGHVAWVEAVHANNTIDVSEYNYSPFIYGERYDASADFYVHFNKGIIKDMSYSGSLSSHAKDEIKVSPSTTFTATSGNTINLFIQ